MTEGKFDKAKGRVKEAAGDVTGDEELEAEGKLDRAAGATKETVGGFFDKVRNVFRRGRRGPQEPV